MESSSLCGSRSNCQTNDPQTLAPVPNSPASTTGVVNTINAMHDEKSSFAERVGSGWIDTGDRLGEFFKGGYQMYTAHDSTVAILATVAEQDIYKNTLLQNVEKIRDQLTKSGLRLSGKGYLNGALNNLYEVVTYPFQSNDDNVMGCKSQAEELKDRLQAMGYKNLYVTPHVDYGITHHYDVTHIDPWGNTITGLDTWK